MAFIIWTILLSRRSLIILKLTIIHGCMCCGQKMTVLEPNTTDAAVEKHVPEYKVEGDTVTVTVSSVEHPMVDEHYIQWISLQTNEGNQRRVLKPGDKPVAVFKLNGTEKVEAAYAYCNLHGLWKK